MHRLTRYRPSPAMVVAFIALLFSLGGTSYAAIVLPANSVGAKQLKKSSVTNPKIKAGAVTSAKVKDGSLTGADILESSLGKVPLATNADNATTLGGYTASALARVAVATGRADVTSGSGVVSVATVTITAPASGFVLVNGYVEAEGGTGRFFVRVWDDSNGHTSGYYNGVTVSGGLVTAGNEWVFPVTEGSRSFSVKAEESTATFVGFGTITAVFIPFGSTGSPTAL